LHKISLQLEPLDEEKKRKKKRERKKEEKRKKKMAFPAPTVVFSGLG
jgi:hypothetical protein